MPLNSVQGLSSGIQWKDIIDAMVNADRASTTKMESRRTTFQGRLDAVRSLNTKLLSLSLDVATLNRSSTFQVRKASTSNESAASAAATNQSVPGTFAVSIGAIAKAHQTRTAGQASASSPYGAGSITITQGSGSPAIVTVDAGNSTLDGIATAINAAGLGVTAAVVNEGSGATPYKLVLSSKTTGLASQIAVSGSGGSLAGLFGAMTDVTAAADATLTMGSGPGALSITQASNTFSNVVNGVTITAKDVAANIQVTVGADTTGAKDRIKAVVESYNAVLDELKSKASYDPSTRLAGPLFSESDIRRDIQRITTTMLSSVPGLPASLSTLTSIGISADRSTGKLSIDAAALDAKLVGDPDGVMRLFTNSGTSTQSSVSFASLTSATSVNAPFSVDILTPAEQAVMDGSALAVSTVITAGVNDKLDLTLGSKTYNLTLAAGSYTADALADHLEAVVNGAVSTLAERIEVSNNGGSLRLRSQAYGYGVSIQTLSSSTALADLGLTAQTVRGVDVVGTIDGVAATGSGQVLTGAAGTTAEGLRLNVTAGSALAGVSVTARKGIAQSLSETVRLLTDSTSGTMSSKDRGLSETISGITKQITRNDERLALRRERYTKMFLAMERSINQSNSLGSFLQGQIAGFENAAASRARG